MNEYTVRILYCPFSRCIHSQALPTTVDDEMTQLAGAALYAAGFLKDVLLYRGDHRYDQHSGLKTYRTQWGEIGQRVDISPSVRPAVETWIEAAFAAAFRAVLMRGEHPNVIDRKQNPDISTESSFLRTIHAAGVDYSVGSRVSCGWRRSECTGK